MMSREKGASGALFLGILLSIFLLAAIALQVLSTRDGGNSKQAEMLAFTTSGLTAAMDAKQAVRGDQSAFDRLKLKQRSLASQDAVREVASKAGDLNDASVAASWGQVLSGITNVVRGQEDISNRVATAVRAGQRVRSLLSNMGDLAAGLPANQRQQFLPTLERFESQAQQLLTGLEQSDSPPNFESLNESNAFLSSVVAALGNDSTMPGVPTVRGEQAQVKLDAIQFAMAELSSELGNTREAADKVAVVSLAAEQIDTASRALYSATESLRTNVAGSGWWKISWLPLALLGGALLSALGLLFAGGNKHETVEAPVADTAASDLADEQQEAILRLLDEMGDLADGDLTVEATVTEDITGAIADAINYAIEALRDLVSTIDGAAESVDSAARQTQASANHLAKASENQSKQVSSATESISKMAHSIDQVSNNAERSSEVTRHSVEIAHKGGEAVRRTIDGMNTIRETIQDTSKRIKRLGESSQEIGNIVELISDIAEQTKILALNASIQASAAGEDGRGFGVVADEVQRLAERSTSATKQIEVLVKTIQADTNEAVVSMERSTTDVVSGALLAENAGAALDEIEKVSNQIASIVQNISGSARQQATAAADVTRNMGVLQEISAQTAENTSATSNSISKLAEMASQLRRSVAGFTLPKERVVEDGSKMTEDEMLVNLATEENEFIDTLIVSEKNLS